jgi:glucose-fructose oxidoreductase
VNGTGLPSATAARASNSAPRASRARCAAHAVAAPEPKAPHRNPVEYLLHCLDHGKPLEGPVSLQIIRIGQEIVDAAVRSAATGRTVRL